MKQRRVLLKILVISVTLGAILLQWATDTVQTNNFILDVRKTYLIPFFETKYLYLYLHLFALACVVPMSFERRLKYYTYWKALFPALLIVSIVFILWDIYKTYVGVWGFNPNYYTFLFINLPIEEWFFFITFPFASVFIYESLHYYFPTNSITKIEPFITITLIILFAIIGFSYWEKAYTSTVFISCAGLLLYQYLFIAPTYRGHFYFAVIVEYIPFILVNAALTGTFTQQPVVMYNPEEYLGLRFISIPLDDFAYNFVMQLSVVTLYEYFKEKMNVGKVSHR